MEKKTKKIENRIEPFLTSDTNLVAYLIVNGFKQANPPRLRDRHVYWAFEKTPGLDQAVQSYNDRNALVDAQTICDCLKKLRILIAGMRG